MRFAAFACALLLWASSAPAASGASAAPDPLPTGAHSPELGALLPGPIDATRYRVGPGDQLTLLLWGAISRAQTLLVGPEGEVVIPELGVVDVSNRTLAEARELLRARVRRSLRNLEVDVQLSRLRSFRVHLTGAVTLPGPLMATGVTTVADLLPDSLLLPDASRRAIEVRHADGSLDPVDLLGFQLTGEPREAVWLRDGDVVHVPRVSRRVGAWGALGRPGPLELGPRDSVSTLIRLAGGLLPKALAEQALLVRWRDPVVRETLAVRFAGVRVTEGDVPLRDGDQLYVLAHPGWHESMQVWVIGRVPREGVFPIRAGATRLTDVVAAAGGLLEDADRSAIRLVRRAPDGQGDPEFDRLLRLSREEMTVSEYESFRAKLAARSPDVRVDWTLIERGRRDLDLFVQDGDIVRVDRRTNAVRVDGQVRRPGLVPYAPGRSVAWYVEQAGGFTRRGARTQVRLTRSANGQGMLARDAADVSPGDQLWVPERPDVSVWQYVRDLLVVGAQIATVYIAVRK